VGAQTPDLVAVVVLIIIVIIMAEPVGLAL
jgi:hypothetical protein